MEQDMSKQFAATRIVEIQAELAEHFVGTPRRAELMFEQGVIWDEFFLGLPYELICEYR